MYMYYYERSYMETIEGMGKQEENGEGEMIAGGCGVPFMHNLSIPVGLALNATLFGGGNQHEFHTEYAGFMQENEYEKVVSGTWINKPTNKKQTRRHKIKPMKVTRKR